MTRPQHQVDDDAWRAFVARHVTGGELTGDVVHIASPPGPGVYADRHATRDQLLVAPPIGGQASRVRVDRPPVEAVVSCVCGRLRWA